MTIGDWGIMDENNAIDGLGSLAQPTRLAAFRKLLAAHPGSVPAGELARACDVPHNTMSTHLGVLSRAGLVQVERDGRTMNYRADVQRVPRAGEVSDARLLQRPSGSVRRHRAPHSRQRRRTRRERVMTPRSTCCFSAPTIRRDRSWRKRCWRRSARASSTPIRPAPIPRAAPMPEVIDRLQDARPRRLRSCAANRGTSSPARTRRAWIS